jgi:hypothetical protein
MEGLRKELFRLGSHGTRVGTLEEGTGCCKVCGEWAADLTKEGLCKTRDCLMLRASRAQAQGKSVCVRVGANTTTVFTDTHEPLPQGPVSREVVERLTGPVCERCGTDYKRPGDSLCVRCRHIVGLNVMTREQAQGKRSRFKARKHRR